MRPSSARRIKSHGPEKQIACPELLSPDERGGCHHSLLKVIYLKTTNHISATLLLHKLRTSPITHAGLVLGLCNFDHKQAFYFGENHYAGTIGTFSHLNENNRLVCKVSFSTLQGYKLGNILVGQLWLIISGHVMESFNFTILWPILHL